MDIMGYIVQFGQSSESCFEKLADHLSFLNGGLFIEFNKRKW